MVAFTGLFLFRAASNLLRLFACEQLWPLQSAAPLC
jgi:hypothetical protein